MVGAGWLLVAGKQRGRWLTHSLPSRPVSLRPPTSPLCWVWREAQADVSSRDLGGVGGALAWKWGGAGGKCSEHVGFDHGGGKLGPDHGAHW